MTDPDTQDATAAEVDETAGQDAVEADAEAQDAEAEAESDVATGAVNAEAYGLDS